MEDIHLPSRSTPAESSANGSSSIGDTPQEQARALALRKKEIEEELGEYIEVVKSHNADVNTPLLDHQGYPRADIDVAAIRSALHRIAMLRNDLAHVTSLLGKALEGVFIRPAAATTVAVNGHSSAPMDLETPSTSGRAFAKVNSVSDESPASQAGLMPGDLLMSLGSAARMSDLPALVAANENQTVPVSVLRGEARLDLQLHPKKWAGRGLLGCHLLPV